MARIFIQFVCFSFLCIVLWICKAFWSKVLWWTAWTGARLLVSNTSFAFYYCVTLSKLFNCLSFFICKTGIIIELSLTGLWALSGLIFLVCLEQYWHLVNSIKVLAAVIYGPGIWNLGRLSPTPKIIKYSSVFPSINFIVFSWHLDF